MNRQESIDSLVKVVEGRDYGDVLNYNEIGEIINQKYGSTKYNDILQAAKRRLEIAGHMIVNVRGIGYKVCYPDGYTSEGVRQMRYGAKRIARGAKIIGHAPVNDMTPEAREAHNRVSDRMAILQAAVAGASVEIHMLESRKHPLLATK